MEHGELSIGKLAKELEISTATINFYVQQGILPPPRKISRTRAAYSERHRRLLRLIRRLQGSGFSLGHIKQVLGGIGDDEAALTRLEGVGYLQPLHPPRLHQENEPLELFEPIAFEAFVERAQLDEHTLRELERIGLLRPQGGRYDARDLHTVRTARLLLEAGIPLERLAIFAERLVPLMRSTFAMTQLLAAQHLEELRRRELFFRDIIEPFMELVGYFFNRVADAEQPGWRGALLLDRSSPPPGSGDQPGPGGERVHFGPRARAPGRSRRGP